MITFLWLSELELNLMFFLRQCVIEINRLNNLAISLLLDAMVNFIWQFDWTTSAWTFDQMLF